MINHVHLCVFILNHVHSNVFNLNHVHLNVFILNHVHLNVFILNHVHLNLFILNHAEFRFDSHEFAMCPAGAEHSPRVPSFYDVNSIFFTYGSQYLFVFIVSSPVSTPLQR